MTLTPQVLFDARQYLGGLDLTGYSNKISASFPFEDLDMTNFGSGSWKERVGGLTDFSASLDMFWQAGDLSMPDDAAWAALGQTSPYTWAPTLGTIGTSLCYLTRVLDTHHEMSGDVGKLLMQTGTLGGNAPVARGGFLHQNGTPRTTTGTGTPVQLGALASTAVRMWTNLHVHSVAGTTPTLVVALQSAATSGGSYTTRVTFNSASVISGQSGSVLGPITDSWWRVSWTITGTTPSFLFTVSAGIGAKS